MYRRDVSGVEQARVSKSVVRFQRKESAMELKLVLEEDEDKGNPYVDGNPV